VPEPETEEPKALTYQELYRRVNALAALLRGFCDVNVGDRVTFHLPMVPELPVSMLACARIGVIHSEVFGGLGGAACGERIADSQSRILVTMDGYYRSGELIDHKAKADASRWSARSSSTKKSRPSTIGLFDAYSPACRRQTRTLLLGDLQPVPRECSPRCASCDERLSPRRRACCRRWHRRRCA
jgi:long-subunit acyl-CoA synthetase (AMP-forming)